MTELTETKYIQIIFHKLSNNVTVTANIKPKYNDKTIVIGRLVTSTRRNPFHDNHHHDNHSPIYFYWSALLSHFDRYLISLIPVIKQFR